jgi:hypothetical protein
VHVPDTAGRYYTLAVTDFFNEVTHIGRRTTGTAEGYFALVGPDFAGQLPEGVKSGAGRDEAGVDTRAHPGRRRERFPAGARADARLLVGAAVAVAARRAARGGRGDPRPPRWIRAHRWITSRC